MTTETMLNKERHEASGGDVEVTRGGRSYRPNVDIVERPDELLLFADLPGARPEDIDVDFEEGQLTIRASLEDRQPEDARHLLREYGVGDYFRTFRVSEQIDPSRIFAQYADGVLKLHLPKAENAKPRKIAVKIGQA